MVSNNRRPYVTTVLEVLQLRCKSFENVSHCKVPKSYSLGKTSTVDWFHKRVARDKKYLENSTVVDFYTSRR